MKQQPKAKPLVVSTQVLTGGQRAVTPMEAAERDPLDLIAEEFAELCRQGKTPSVSDFVQRYPAYAEELRELLPTVGQMETLKRQRRPAAEVLDTHPERIGDFRIVREIGRGGMGIVFEAEQTSLGRKVALKILPAAARADADKRGRFLREAQAAARLHHTNIVPVFGVGEENGVPYYVMQFIRGCGLDDLMHGWRTEPDNPSPILQRRDWPRIAQLIAQAADALNYAHAEGVLHRDVKPGNLLLDTSGHLWVADFGLAKLLDETGQTATGQVLGTLQYMAPEALASQADARTDVYGLGMTLYELLTGRMPFEESNPAVLVKLIGAREPPPPRSLDRSIPRTLETICLKAIAREPSRRYQTAADLAEDLRAYLEGRPIAARRVSAWGRAWLWARRNPEIAGLSAAILLMLGVSAFLGWSKYATERAALLQETAARKKESEQLETEKRLRIQADEANKRYQRNLEMSLEAMEKILGLIAMQEPGGPGPGGPGPGGHGSEGDRRPLGPGGQGPGGPPSGDRRPPGPEGDRRPLLPFDPKMPRREDMLTNSAQLLEEILAFYEKFADENESNLKLKFDAARAYRRVAEIHFFLGRPEKARQALQKSQENFEELRERYQDPQAVRRELEEIERKRERWQRWERGMAPRPR